MKGVDDRVLLWVEVGLPEPDRIIKASRHSVRIALVAGGKTSSNWEQQHMPKLLSIRNLTVLCFNQSFISSLVSKLDRSINWEVTISDGSLYINVGDETFDTVLQLRVGKR